MVYAGVPQGSVLGPTLYSIYTCDTPHLQNITVATYADDTAFMASAEGPIAASTLLEW